MTSQGKDDQLKNITDFAEQSENKLIKFEDSAPFTFKRNSITIGRNKISIIERGPLKQQTVTSINIEDLLNVTVSTNALYGTINLYTRYYVKEPLKMKSLSRKDALRAKRIIQGLLVCRERKMDITDVPPVELVIQLERIGTA